MIWKPKAPQKMVFEITKGYGESSLHFRLEVPANTPFDDIDALLTLFGAIAPQNHPAPPAKKR